jgi:hypothetical protein
MPLTVIFIVLACEPAHDDCEPLLKIGPHIESYGKGLKYDSVPYDTAASVV